MTRRRGVAGQAVGHACVVDYNRVPVSGVVALGAQGRIMGIRCFRCVAGQTICQVVVAEGNVLPVAGGVAVGALPRVVLCR